MHRRRGGTAADTQCYLLRWQVEVTFEELRAHLGMETPRQWSEQTIARTTPAFFGLFRIARASVSRSPGLRPTPPELSSPAGGRS